MSQDEQEIAMRAALATQDDAMRCAADAGIAQHIAESLPAPSAASPFNASPAIDWAPGIEGVFADIPSEDYHRESSGISRSMAVDLLWKSPEHMRYSIDNPRESTSWMDVGTVVHCACLEPDRLKDSFYLRPETYQGADRKKTIVTKKWNGNATVCSEWLEAHADKPVLTEAQSTNVFGCVGKLRAHPMLAAMIATGQSELSCFARYEGTLVRCRPDLMAYDAEGRLWVVDLKKVQDASRDEFRRHARRFRYDFQEAWYRFVLGILGLEVYQFFFAAVEEDPPHGVAVYPLARENVIEQEPNVHRAIDMAVQCADHGHWPGYEIEQDPIGWRTQT